MSEYRFHLQKYKYGSKISCPSCGKPRCFVKYVDAEGEIAFPGNVGKCDHENSCGYHYTPKEYFKHHSVRLQSLSPRHSSNKVWLYSRLNRLFLLMMQSYPLLG